MMINNDKVLNNPLFFFEQPISSSSPCHVNKPPSKGHRLPQLKPPSLLLVSRLLASQNTNDGTRSGSPVPSRTGNKTLLLHTPQTGLTQYLGAD